MTSGGSAINANKVLRLPMKTQSLFKHYTRLKIQDLEIVCPYHINTGLIAKNRALAGKGLLHEIEAVAGHYLTKFQMHSDGDKDQLIRYMNACGLGVDCSGFAAWILNSLTMHFLNKPLPSCLKFNGKKKALIAKVRPYENISANLITGTVNAIKIDAINDIKPGDMIRLINGGHVIVISEVGFDKQGKVTYFKYIQSTVSYGERQGVEEGKVCIIKRSGYLSDQDWLDELIYSDLKKSNDDACLVRLRALAAL